MATLIIHSVPWALPIVLLVLGTHSFMKTHKWHETIGAFINVEAAGIAGPDLVCQFGPGSWPSKVYVQSAVYPMAHSATQDVFPIVPGDTDYRIFSQDYGNIPGLDIIFLLDQETSKHAETIYSAL